jgi:hypothetical protein
LLLPVTIGIVQEDHKMVLCYFCPTPILFAFVFVWKKNWIWDSCEIWFFCWLNFAKTFLPIKLNILTSYNAYFTHFTKHENFFH